MDVSIVVASIAGTVALPSARLATTQATKARKSGRTEQLEAKLDQLTADRHLLYLWNRQLVDHIYRGIGPPPPQPPPGPFTNDQKGTPMLIDHPTIRLYLYLIGLTALAIAPLIALWQPEIATPIRDGANPSSPSPSAPPPPGSPPPTPSCHPGTPPVSGAGQTTSAPPAPAPPHSTPP